jgi:Zn-dependent protease with chaperone function
VREPANPAADTPAPSHLRLTFLILEGYLYLALILAIFLSATGFLVWGLLTRRPFIAIVAILVGVPVAATTARAFRALWFVFPQPKGIDVGPHFGALLYRTVQEIAQRVRAPRVHRIVVTGANNASALQIARAGVFWPTNTLVLGYPLLATLSVDQMRAVIAHELGHMTHAHGRFSSWVHRTRLSWVRLLDILERHQSVPAHVYLLFRFYVPRLHAQGERSVAAAGVVGGPTRS